MKLRLAYTHRGIPVEISLEGEGLEPAQIPALLGRCIAALQEWMDKVMLKSEDGEGDVYPPCTPPQPTAPASNQQTPGNGQ